MPKQALIPLGLYKQILQSVPLVSVDYILVRGSGKKREFLLGMRANKPYKGQWYIPGGRVLWGEDLNQALTRQLKLELGLIKASPEFLCHYSFVHPPGEQGVKYHSIYHVYLVKLPSNFNIINNKENSQTSWFSKIDGKWPKPVKDILLTAGFNF